MNQAAPSTIHCTTLRHHVSSWGKATTITIICLLVSSSHVLCFEIPVPIIHYLCHTHSKPFTCHSGKLSEKLIVSYSVFPSYFCHSLVTHTVIGIIIFFEDLTIQTQLKSSAWWSTAVIMVLRNEESKMHETLSHWCCGDRVHLRFLWRRPASWEMGYRHSNTVWKLTWWTNTWKTHERVHGP